MHISGKVLVYLHLIRRQGVFLVWSKLAPNHPARAQLASLVNYVSGKL